MLILALLPILCIMGKLNYISQGFKFIITGSIQDFSGEKMKVNELPIIWPNTDISLFLVVVEGDTEWSYCFNFCKMLKIVCITWRTIEFHFSVRNCLKRPKRPKITNRLLMNS